jgi:hypothetical protein
MYTTTQKWNDDGDNNNNNNNNNNYRLVMWEVKEKGISYKKFGRKTIKEETKWKS